MKRSLICLAALMPSLLLAGVRLENRFAALDFLDDASVSVSFKSDNQTIEQSNNSPVPFVGAVKWDGSFVPAVKAEGDERAIDFTLADGGTVRLLVTSFGDGWIFETRNAALKGAKELRFVRTAAKGDDKTVVLVRAAHIRTALLDEDGIRSAAALSGSGFDQQRAILAIAPKDYEGKLLARIALVGGPSAVRKDGPWAENLVANPEIDVPESWRPKKIAGRDFRASITGLLVGHFGGCLANLPDMAAFRHAIVSLSCDYDVRSLDGRDFHVNTKERKGPYTIEDVLAVTARSKDIYEDMPKHPDVLFTVGMPVRPLVTLTKDEFGADREDFRRWRAAHPQFAGFSGFSESDGDYNGYRQQVLANRAGKKLIAKTRTVDGKPQEVTVPQEVQRIYPVTDDNTADYANFMRIAWNQMRKVYFGSDEISGLYSMDMALGHVYAALGVKTLECEVAMNCVSGPWAWSGAFLRGASRQFGCAPVWYMARFLGGGKFSCTRDGRSASGDQRWPRGVRPAFTPYLGGGRSMNRRGYFYGWASGCSSIMVEGDCLIFIEDGPDGKPAPSVYCRDFNDIFELAERVDRGVPYTPIALLGSQRESVGRHGYPKGSIAPYAHNAFLFTLTPINRSSPLMMSDRDKGDLGCFWNSRFGEIWDYLTCDSPQDQEVFGAALSHYPVAFLVGEVDGKTFAAKALEDYVKGGGTLFVTADNVRKGLVEPSFAGVTYGEEKVPFRLGGYDYTAIRPTELAADVTRFDTAFAPTDLQLFTSRPVGKGRVVTCAVERYLPDVLRDPKPDAKDQPSAWAEEAAGRIDFPLVRELLAKVQGETIPFEIRGSCQWGVNRTAKGWLVWLMNNEGVTKFAGEPEEFDFDRTAHVTVVSKLTGEAKSVTIEPGATAFLEF